MLEKYKAVKEDTAYLPSSSMFRGDLMVAMLVLGRLAYMCVFALCGSDDMISFVNTQHMTGNQIS